VVTAGNAGFGVGEPHLPPESGDNLGITPVQWAAIEALFDRDPVRHHAATAVAGLDVPLEVFEQLFHDHFADTTFEPIVRGVDWARVEWTGMDLAGVALRDVRVPRIYQHAVDEARAFTLEGGLQDDRPAVVEHWHEASTWLTPPVIVTRPVLGSSGADELLVGFTRLGSLLGLLDRGDVSGAATHRVWLGRRMTA
jgi:hypothetical protein